MIAIIYPELDGVHGIARYVQSFLRHSEKNFQSIILITAALPAGKLPDNIKVKSIPMGTGKLALLIWSLKARRYLKAFSESSHIDNIFLQWPPLLPCLITPNIAPITLVSHTTYLGMSGGFYNERYFDSQWGKLSVKCRMVLERIIINKCSSLIALTAQGSEELKRYQVAKPVEIIPNGVDLSKFTNSSSTVKDYDVIFAGRIEARKGSKSLISACKFISETIPGCKICIVGYGEDLEIVKSELGSFKNIDITGRVNFDSMIDYFNRSKIYVSTSYYEGLPGTCIEAMSLGLPPVVWNFEFYSGLVHNKVNGLVTPPDDYAALADSVSTLLSNNDTYEYYSKNAQQTSRSHYNWEDIYLDILNHIEGQSRLMKLEKIT